MAGRNITHPLLEGLRQQLRRSGVDAPLCWRGRAGRGDIAVAGLAPALKSGAAKILYAPHQRLLPKQAQKSVVAPFGLDVFADADPERGRSIVTLDTSFVTTFMLDAGGISKTVALLAPFLHKRDDIFLVVAVFGEVEQPGEALGRVVEEYGLERRFLALDLVEEGEVGDVVAASGAVFWYCNGWEYPQAIFGAAVLGIPAVVAGDADWLRNYAVVCEEDAVSVALDAVFGRRLPAVEVRWRWCDVAAKVAAALEGSSYSAEA